VTVLVIPEDFRKDQYILKPIFSRLLREVGKPRARIRLCQDPLLGGVGEATKSERIQEIIQRYRAMVRIFVLCIDRDGDPGRRQRLNQLEQECGDDLGDDRVFLAENAGEEIETWVLAGLELPDRWRWADVRAEVQVKEAYFDPLALERVVADRPGGGRKPLAEEAAGRFDAIRQKCREDFDVLVNRVQAAVATVPD